jgi:hypothetical protein
MRIVDSFPHEVREDIRLRIPCPTGRTWPAASGAR